MAYDSLRDRTVLFRTDPKSFETWEWDGTLWRQVAHIGPGPRQEHVLAFDGRAVVLFGGLVPADGNVLRADGETWEWDGLHWVEILDIGPPRRSQHAMTFDSARNRVVSSVEWDRLSTIRTH